MPPGVAEGSDSGAGGGGGRGDRGRCLREARPAHGCRRRLHRATRRVSPSGNPADRSDHLFHGGRTHQRRRHGHESHARVVERHRWQHHGHEQHRREALRSLQGRSGPGEIQGDSLRPDDRNVRYRDCHSDPGTGRVGDRVPGRAQPAGRYHGGAQGGHRDHDGDERGKSGTSAITVTFVPVATVTVTPASANLAVGQTVQLTATTKDANGNPLSGRTITWSSSNTAVATVTTSGSVKGVTAGSATITATSEGQSGASAISVRIVPVATVAVSPASASVQVGGTVQLTAVTKDSVGNTLTGRTITWASSNSTVATVSTTGLVSGLLIGSATITATSEGKSGSSAITVTPVPVHSGYYAATNGSSSGDGSSGRPWNLATALSGGNGKVQPGDTVWLR